MVLPRPLCSTLVMTILAVAPLAAHEEGVIRLTSPTAAPGEVIEIRGERLPRATVLRLEVRGALAAHPLGEVRSDDAGVFVARLALPAEIDPGRYRVIALAPDGDEVARAELAVVSAPPGAIVAPSPARPVHATDAAMDLSVSHSPGEWAVIAAFVLACLAVGGVLLRLSEPRSSTASD